METLIGLWRTYRPGEIYAILGGLIGDVVKQGKRLTIPVLGKKEIHSVDELHEMLKRYEMQKGICDFVNLLCQGIDVHGRPGGPRIRVLLRFPEGSERDKLMFKDLIVNAVMREDFSFTDRHFREQGHDWFHSRLERILKKRFGFCFEYKVIVEPSGRG